jgi:hypothetical protein
MKKQVYFEEEEVEDNSTNGEESEETESSGDFSLQDVGGNEKQAMERFRFFVNSINLILRTIVEKNKKLHAILTKSKQFDLIREINTSEYDEYINYNTEEQPDDLTDKQKERLAIANKLAKNYYTNYDDLKTKFDQIKGVLERVTDEISKDNGGEINKQAVYNFLGSFETASEFEKYKDNVVVGNITLGDLMGSYKALRQNYLQQKKLIKVAKEFLQTDEQPEDIRAFDPTAGGLSVNQTKVKKLLGTSGKSAYNFLRSFIPQPESIEETLIREGLLDAFRSFFASDIPNQNVQEIPNDFSVKTLENLEQFIGYLKGYNEMIEPAPVTPEESNDESPVSEVTEQEDESESTQGTEPLTKTKADVLTLLKGVKIIVNKEMLENKRALKELSKFQNLENIQKVFHQKEVYDFLKEKVFEGDVPETAFVGINNIKSDNSTPIKQLKDLEPKQLRLIMNTKDVVFEQQESKQNLLTRLIKEELKRLKWQKNGM